MVRSIIGSDIQHLSELLESEFNDEAERDLKSTSKLYLTELNHLNQST